MHVHAVGQFSSHPLPCHHPPSNCKEGLSSGTQAASQWLGIGNGTDADLAAAAAAAAGAAAAASSGLSSSAAYNATDGPAPFVNPFELLPPIPAEKLATMTPEEVAKVKADARQRQWEMQWYQDYLKVGDTMSHD